MSVRPFVTRQVDLAKALQAWPEAVPLLVGGPFLVGVASRRRSRS